MQKMLDTLARVNNETGVTTKMIEYWFDGKPKGVLEALKLLQEWGRHGLDDGVIVVKGPGGEVGVVYEPVSAYFITATVTGSRKFTDAANALTTAEKWVA